MEKKRIAWIDIAKAIGIIIVLTFHACPEGYFKSLLWQMHMPLFAFLSGLIYSNRYSEAIQCIGEFIFMRIKSIYCPFVNANCCMAFSYVLLCKVVYVKNSSFERRNDCNKRSHYGLEMDGLLCFGWHNWLIGDKCSN